jgi:hypothetical protein
MVPAQAQIQPKAFAMSMNKEALTGTFGFEMHFMQRTMVTH